MDQVNSALQLVGSWLEIALGVLLRILAVIDVSARQGLTQIGVPPNVQTVVLLVIDVLFIVLVLRLFGGFFRVLLILFLILLVLHILGAGL